MERFEFDSKTGPNSNRREGSTRRGAIEVYPDFQQPGLLSLDIRGPAHAYRGNAVIDRATARKLGVRLLQWAGCGGDLYDQLNKLASELFA